MIIEAAASRQLQISASLRNNFYDIAIFDFVIVSDWFFCSRVDCRYVIPANVSVDPVCKILRAASLPQKECIRKHHTIVVRKRILILDRVNRNKRKQLKRRYFKGPLDTRITVRQEGTYPAQRVLPALYGCGGLVDVVTIDRVLQG